MNITEIKNELKELLRKDGEMTHEEGKRFDELIQLQNELINNDEIEFKNEINNKKNKCENELNKIENKNIRKEKLKDISNKKEAKKNNPIDVQSIIDDEIFERISIQGSSMYLFKEKFNYATKEMEEIEERLTNFLISYKSKATFEEQQLIKYIVTIKKNNKEFNIEMPSSALVDSKSFKNFLARNLGGEFIYYSNDNDLNLLKEYLSLHKYKENIGIEKLGFIKDKDDNYRFIDSSNEIEGFQKQDDYSGLKANLFGNEEITKNELENLSKFLFCWNDKENTIPTVLFPICCLLNKKLDDCNIKLFHYMATGESGSGKSTGLEEIIMPMLAMDESCKNKAGSTDFVNIKITSRSNTFPAVLDEYKPWQLSQKQKASLSELLRSSYDKQVQARGRANQSINKYRLEAPIILIGEKAIEETAIEDRSIQLHFSKINHNPIGLNAIKKLKRLRNVTSKLGRSCLEEILNIDNEWLINEFENNFKLLNGFNMNSRKIEHVSKLLIALKILERVYNKNNLDLDELCNVNQNIFLKNIKETQENIDSKSVVELTLEKYDLIYRELQKDWHYKFLDDGNLAIDIKNTYPKILKYFRESSIDEEILSYKEFIKQLKTSIYFVENKPIKLNVGYESVANQEDRENSKKALRCFILKTEKLKENLDFGNML